MLTDGFIPEKTSVCNLSYITGIMAGRKHLIKEIFDVFLMQVPEELSCINAAVTNNDHASIKRIAHSMQSSVSIMGIAELKSILEEMKTFDPAVKDIEEIKLLAGKLNAICHKAFEEIENERQNYI